MNRVLLLRFCPGWRLESLQFLRCRRARPPKRPSALAAIAAQHALVLVALSQSVAQHTVIRSMDARFIAPLITGAPS